MATQANGTATAGDPRAVGNAFIGHYYNILKQSPNLLHRFYTDISELSRPGPDGEMTSVTTMQVSSVGMICQNNCRSARLSKKSHMRRITLPMFLFRSKSSKLLGSFKGINDKILSMGFEKCHLQILTSDAQASYKGGVFVLVTGRLTGKDDMKRIFSQAFFLAPQDNGFFVLNDIFRYMEGESAAPISASQEEEDAKSVDVSFPDPEPTIVAAPEVGHPEVEVKIVNAAEESAVVKEDITESFSNISQENAQGAVLAPVSEDGPSNAPKKSFASIVSALKQNNVPFQVRAPWAKSPGQTRAVTTPEASTPDGIGIPERTESTAAKRYSIFVGNLPLDAAPAQLEAAFKKFGSIRPNGIQVRSTKGSCYGFVEFESESAMRSALQDTSILIGNRTAHIEEQKKDNVDRGRPQGRGSFRNDQYRNRGGFSGERSGGDFSGRGGGIGFRRDSQNGGRRGLR